MVKIDVDEDVEVLDDVEVDEVEVDVLVDVDEVEVDVHMALIHLENRVLLQDLCSGIRRVNSLSQPFLSLSP